MVKRDIVARTEPFRQAMVEKIHQISLKKLIPERLKNMFNLSGAVLESETFHQVIDRMIREVERKHKTESYLDPVNYEKMIEHLRKLKKGSWKMVES